MIDLETLIEIAGAIQIAIVLTMLWVPRVLDWRGLLAPLHPFMRRLLWVYAAFITFVNLGFGVLSLRHAGELATTPLGRGVCCFIAVYWLARLCVQFFVFDIRPFLLRPFLRFGYHGLSAGFIYLASVYGLAAVFPLLGVRP